MKTIKLVLLALLSITVSACGGGGGNNLGISAPTAPIIINTTDATQIKNITAAALSTAMGSTFDAFNPTNLSNVIINSFNTGVTNTSCAVGSMDITIDVFFGTGTIKYNDCLDSFGNTFNGTVSLANMVFSQNPNPDSFSASVTFNDITVTGPSTVTLSGGYEINATGLNFPPKIISATGTNAHLKLISNGQANEIYDFNFYSEISPGFLTTDTHIFTLASSALGGSILYATSNLIPFETFSASTHPSTGEATIMGGDPSQLLLSASLTQVQVSTSTTGGTFVPFTAYTWAELNL